MRKIITQRDFNFKKVNKLYGILKSFRISGGYFTIYSKNEKYKISVCSLLILLSLCRIKEDVYIKLECDNPIYLEEFAEKIENLS